MAKRRSLAEIVAAELSAHVKDCMVNRKRAAKALDQMSMRQISMHEENKRERVAETARIRADIADIRREEATRKAIRQKWMIRSQRAMIALLVTGLAYTVWHIIVTKGMTP